MQDTFYLYMVVLSLTGTKLSTVTLGVINSLILIYNTEKQEVSVVYAWVKNNNKKLTSIFFARQKNSKTWPGFRCTFFTITSRLNYLVCFCISDEKFYTISPPVVLKYFFIKNPQSKVLKNVISPTNLRMREQQFPLNKSVLYAHSSTYFMHHIIRWVSVCS